MDIKQAAQREIDLLETAIEGRDSRINRLEETLENIYENTRPGPRLTFEQYEWKLEIIHQTIKHVLNKR